MKKKLSLMTGLLILILGNYLSAQNLSLDWGKRMGGSIDDAGRSIAVDNDGNVYSTGYFEDLADFDPGSDTFNLSSNGAEDIFIQKLDPEGNLEWVRQIGSYGDDEGWSITVDNDGNVYIAGSFNFTVDFDPGPDTLNFTSVEDDDIFIQKLDSSGNLIWVKQLGGEDDDNVSSICVDVAGNVYTTGAFRGSIDFDPGPEIFNLSTGSQNFDIFVHKLDSLGDFVWVKQMGGGEYDGGRSISVDTAGYVYSTGTFQGSVDFDPGPEIYNLDGAGESDIFIQKLDQSGSFVWVRQIGSSGNEYCYSISVDNDGNVYTTGHFEETIDFDPGMGVLNLTSAGELDIFVQKLNTSGSLVWVKQIGGTDNEQARAIAIDDLGNVYTTGRFSGTVDFDPGMGVHNLTSSGTSNSFIHKLDSTGDFIWVKHFEESSTGYLSSRHIGLDDLGNVYTMGGFEGTIDIDPGMGVLNLTSAGEDDIFISKMNQCYISASINSDIGFNICEGENANLTVNANGTYLWSTGDTSVAISVSPEITTTYSVTVTNTDGCFVTLVNEVIVETTPTALFDFVINDSIVNFNNLSSSNTFSFEWDFGDGTTNTENNPNHTYSQNGNYSVQLLASNDCGTDTIIQNVEVIITGIKIINVDAPIEIYPNPVTDMLNFKSHVPIDRIQITNLVGQNVANIKKPQSSGELNLNNLSTGIYVITFVSKYQVWSIAVEKQ